MMKETGIIRKLDDLGRLVIPKALRETIGINEGDPLEFFIDENAIIVRRYNVGCVFCGTVEGDLKNYKGRLVCKKCVSEMN